MQKDFQGKAVIVTGSSCGIGEAIAIHFAKLGAMVTVCGRNRERLEAVLAKCQEASKDKTTCILVCGDITDPAVQEETLSATVQHFHRLDVLVCNHGVIVPFPSVSSVTTEQYDLVMNTNLKSSFFLTQKAIPHLEKTQGCVINMSSIASSMVFPRYIVYGLSKAALDHLTKTLALELAPKETALKNKWKSVRDYFAAEYNKRPVPRSGDAGSNRPQSKWQFFNQLIFLKDIVAPRTSFDSLDLDNFEGNEPRSGIADDSATEVDTQGSNVESQVPDTFDNPTSFEAPEPGLSQEFSPGALSSKRTNRTAGPSKKRSRDSSDSYRELIDIEERKLQYLSQKRENAEQTNDADFLFLKSLQSFTPIHENGP